MNHFSRLSDQEHAPLKFVSNGAKATDKTEFKLLEAQYILG